MNVIEFPRRHNDAFQARLARERLERCRWQDVQEAMALAAVDDSAQAQAQPWKARQKFREVFAGGGR